MTRSADKSNKMPRIIWLSFGLISIAFFVVVTDLIRAKAGNVATLDANPVALTAEQDHRRMLDLLKISKLRPGANPRSTDPATAPNYDEAKANPSGKTVSNKSSQRQLGDGSSTFYKNRFPEFLAPTAKYQTYIETSSGILKALVEKDLNMRLGDSRRLHDSEAGCWGHTQDFAVGAELFGSVF